MLPCILGVEKCQAEAPTFLLFLFLLLLGKPAPPASPSVSQLHRESSVMSAAEMGAPGWLWRKRDPFLSPPSSSEPWVRWHLDASTKVEISCFDSQPQFLTSFPVWRMFLSCQEVTLLQSISYKRNGVVLMLLPGVCEAAAPTTLLRVGLEHAPGV